MSGDGDLFDLPAVAGFDVERYRRLQNEREAAWGRFREAADGYLAGDGGKAARVFLEAVEAQYGPQVAQQQRRELWNWLKAKQGSK